MVSFIDTNIIIKAFTRNKETDKCRKALSEPFITNTLCLIEAQHAISVIKKDKVYAAVAIKSLFSSSGTIIDSDKNLLFNASRNISRYHLNIFDLIHYTTALQEGCSQILSYDKDFDGLEIKRVEP